MTTSLLLRPALLIAALGFVAACSSSSNTPSAAPSTATPTTAATSAETTAAPTTVAPTTAATTAAAPTTTAAPATTAAGAALAVAANPQFGQVVVDGTGMSLYLFEKDNSTSTACTGGCAGAWPPNVVKGQPVVAAGINQALVDTIQRPDGTVQVTYGGHPLYRFAGDTAPGQTNGQESGELWYLISPAGAKIGT